jgi:hypothetical protein
VTILGPLADELPEPMTKEQFDAARRRLKASLDQIVMIDKREFERLIDEVIWLKRRLHRVENVIAPLAEDLRQLARVASSIPSRDAQAHSPSFQFLDRAEKSKGTRGDRASE